MSDDTSVIVTVMIIVSIAITVGWVLLRKRYAFSSVNATRSMSGKSCTSACGEIDDVNDPRYNVVEVIKNTLLIEQHLAIKSKYCKACIVKHFLLSCGLLEEAIWMAGQGLAAYPQLAESYVFNERLFKQWFQGMDNDVNRLDVLDKLRAWRRNMVQLYYFHE